MNEHEVDLLSADTISSLSSEIKGRFGVIYLKSVGDLK
jgi:hypothetical protein